MDVKSKRGCNQSEDEMELRRGPWTIEEDYTLINNIAHNGEGRWNSLSRAAGLKRTGKSCRLRWLNYLRPDVRRGNISLEEQLLILELHSRWGNQWSKIAQHLPGRTDNEIKNYWRTRVQKHAKQLKCDVNSKQFKDAMRYLWMPRLVERIQAAAATANASTTANNQSQNSIGSGLDQDFDDQVIDIPQGNMMIGNNLGAVQTDNSSFTPGNSSTGASSDSFGTQVSPVSDLIECYNYPALGNPNNDQDFNYPQLGSPCGYFNHGLDFQAMLQNSQSLDGLDVSDNLWNPEDYWYLKQLLNKSV